MFTPWTEASGKRWRNILLAISFRDFAEAHAVAWMRAMELSWFGVMPKA